MGASAYLAPCTYQGTDCLFCIDASIMVTISSITGGTEAYEGASGWIGVILDDQGNWKGFMKGEICTP